MHCRPLLAIPAVASVRAAGLTADVRAREYLTDAEVSGLIVAAGRNHYGHRDATMVLIAYRHGLRAAELVTLRWDAIDFGHGRIHVRRVKGGSESVHPLSGRELRALRRLKREQDPASPFTFTTERAAPFSPAGFRKMIARLGVAAGIGFPVHPRMLRHAAASSSPMTASIPGRFRPIWATATSSTQCATPSWRRPAS